MGPRHGGADPLEVLVLRPPVRARPAAACAEASARPAPRARRCTWGDGERCKDTQDHEKIPRKRTRKAIEKLAGKAPERCRTPQCEVTPHRPAR